MNIRLTPEMERMVQSQVSAGRYDSPNDVVRQALRLLEDNVADRASRLQELRDHIDTSLAEGGRGEGVDGETFLQGLLDEIDACEARHQPG